MGPFEKYKMWGWGSPKILGKLRVKFPTLNANISAPKGFGEEILVRSMQNLQQGLTFKADGGGSLPEFLANFCDFFRPKKTSKGQFTKL